MAYNASAAAVLQKFGWGVDAIYDDASGRYLVVYSANPFNSTRSWRHDIYAFFSDASRGVSQQPLVLAGAGSLLAKAPASSAVNSNGRLLVTAEEGPKNDGWQFEPNRTISSQSYGIWDLKALASNATAADTGPPPVAKPWSVTELPNSHSGHVSSNGALFLIAYSSGRTAIPDDGSGMPGFTGDRVLALIVDNDGKPVGSPLSISPNTAEDHDSWPVVASSPGSNRWVIVWQRYPSRRLFARVVAADGALANGIVVIADGLQWFHYTVAYSKRLDMFLVLGAILDANKSINAQTSPATGFLAGLDPVSGKITFATMGLPTPVREAKIIYVDAPIKVKRRRRRLQRRTEKRLRKEQNLAGLWHHIIVDEEVVEELDEVEDSEETSEEAAPRQTAIGPNTVYIVYPVQPTNRLALVNVTSTGAAPWLDLTVNATFPGLGLDGYAYSGPHGQRINLFTMTSSGVALTNHSVDAFFTGIDIPENQQLSGLGGGGTGADGGGSPYEPSYIDPSAGDFVFTILAAIFTGLFTTFVFGVGYWKMWEDGDGCFKPCPRKKRVKGIGQIRPPEVNTRPAQPDQPDVFQSTWPSGRPVDLGENGVLRSPRDDMQAPLYNGQVAMYGGQQSYDARAGEYPVPTWDQVSPTTPAPH